MKHTPRNVQHDPKSEFFEKLKAKSCTSGFDVSQICLYRKKNYLLLLMEEPIMQKRRLGILCRPATLLPWILK